MFLRKKKPQISYAPAPTGPAEFVVVGLGNPGRRYDDTRHNVGFAAIDIIAGKYGCAVDRLQFKSMCGHCNIGGKHVLLLKPDTFMNLSGQAVVQALNYYKLDADKILVLSDDVSLDPGRMRIRLKGSDGGHNGLKNIIYLTGRNDFARIKIGVGAKPHPDYALADWVLGKFSSDDAKKVGEVYDNICDAVELMVSGRSQEAMGKYNGAAK